MTKISPDIIKAKQASKLTKRSFALKQHGQVKHLDTKVFAVNDACVEVLEQANLAEAKVKFDQTIDVAVKLGIDPRKETVRGTVPAEHSLGKVLRVAVFCRGDNQAKSKACGADVVGAEELVEQVQKGEINFDKVVATPDMMMQLGKIAKILGPKGLMPNPKLGTVTTDVEAAIKAIKAGQINYKIDKAGIIHAAIGKATFTADKLQQNFNVLIEAIKKARPSTTRGSYIKQAHLSSTMGLSVAIDCQSL
ncbi:MAG: 50S ribosomal protein L1 [Pseudomonadota bacterium]